MLKLKHVVRFINLKLLLSKILFFIFLGFLSLRDKDCDVPGNAGLKDQVMALRWVKNNCHFFGGNSENITVFGESAGAASTHYLTMTEQTRNLFHKAVIMSGTAMSSWANIPHLDWAYRLAKSTGYRGENNDKDVFAHLKHKKPGGLLKVCDDLLTMDERLHSRLNFSFGPCVEPYKTEHCVIDREPLEMLRDCWGNSIPLLIGGNSFEGLLSFPEVRKYPDLVNKLGDGECLPPSDANLTKEKRLEYGRMIMKLYFGDKQPSWDTILQYSDVSYGNTFKQLKKVFQFVCLHLYFRFSLINTFGMVYIARYWQGVNMQQQPRICIVSILIRSILI